VISWLKQFTEAGKGGILQMRKRSKSGARKNEETVELRHPGTGKPDRGKKNGLALRPDHVSTKEK
jgi:hypothetical protein